MNTFISHSGSDRIILEISLPLEEVMMTRLQRTWTSLFILAVTCSLLFSTVAFALNDPK
jgi:hypothetical protein